MDQHDEGYYEDHRHSMNQPSYCMIEWDPAHQDPPKTGALTAEIPDLSNFKNAWDQPAVQNNIWVAPLHHPDPKVMTRHEYAEYDTKEYEMAQTQFHHDIIQQHTTHHSDETKMEHSYEDQNKEINQYEHMDSSNHEYHPDHHQESLNHHQQGLAKMEPVIQTIGHPSIFPWEPSQHEPTRIWLDEQPSLETTIPVPSISNNNDNNEVPVDHEHVTFPPASPPVFPWENVEHHFPPPTRIWQDEQQPLDAQGSVIIFFNIEKKNQRFITLSERNKHYSYLCESK
jgi:hypothetical protein